MKHIRFSTNFTIFLLFFGVTAMEAIRKQSVTEIVFWGVIAIVFLLADIKKN